MSLLSDATATFSENYIIQAGRELISEGVNFGREEEAEIIEATGAQYSAYMEGNVCEFCASLDEMTVDLRTDEGRQLFDQYSPAQHNNCDCNWIYIEEKRFENDNKDFHEKWLDKFHEQNPDLKDFTVADVLQKYGHFNLQTRAQYWIDFPGFNIITQEVMFKRLQKKKIKFIGNIAEELGLKDVEIGYWDI